MPSLHIGDLPEDIYEAPGFRAASEHRSLTQQALADLTQAVKSNQTDTLILKPAFPDQGSHTAYSLRQHREAPGTTALCGGIEGCIEYPAVK